MACVTSTTVLAGACGESSDGTRESGEGGPEGGSAHRVTSVSVTDTRGGRTWRRQIDLRYDETRLVELEESLDGAAVGRTLVDYADD